MTHDELTDHIVEQVRARDITTLEYAIRVAIDLYRDITTLSPTHPVEAQPIHPLPMPKFQDPTMVADADGQWVRLSDYQALKARLSAVEGALEGLADAVRGSIDARKHTAIINALDEAERAPPAALSAQERG